jgi:hypothetical protein
MGSPQVHVQIPPPTDGEAIEFATPISDDDEERLDAFHEDSPMQYHRMDQVIGDEPNPGQAVRNACAGMTRATTAGVGGTSTHHW